MRLSMDVVRRLEALERQAHTGVWTPRADTLPPPDVAKLRVIVGMLVEAGVTDLSDSPLADALRALLAQVDYEREGTHDD